MDTIMGERKAVFDISLRGYRIRAFYRGEKDQNADIQIDKGEEPFKSFEYPAYRIWNLAAHFDDIVNNLNEQESANA